MFQSEFLFYALVVYDSCWKKLNFNFIFGHYCSLEILVQINATNALGFFIFFLKMRNPKRNWIKYALS